MVGPLLKNNVDELVKSNTPLNVLALNQPESVQSRANICYFALSPEDEARDAARHIHEQGKQSPLLLIPRSALGDRVANAFAQSGKIWEAVRYCSRNLAQRRNCVWALTAVPALP